MIVKGQGGRKVDRRSFHNTPQQGQQLHTRWLNTQMVKTKLISHDSSCIDGDFSKE